MTNPPPPMLPAAGWLTASERHGDRGVDGVAACFRTAAPFRGGADTLTTTPFLCSLAFSPA